MESRICWSASVCAGGLLLNASWFHREVAGANELDGPGLLHLELDAVVAVNAKETWLAPGSPDHLEEIQLCEIGTGARRVGLSALSDTELVHLELMEPCGYLRGVTRSGNVLVGRKRESPNAVELEKNRVNRWLLGVQLGRTYRLLATDLGDVSIHGSMWDLERIKCIY